MVGGGGGVVGGGGGVVGGGVGRGGGGPPPSIGGGGGGGGVTHALVASVGHGSVVLGWPSPSVSGSQASPMLSLSRSAWSALDTVGQLSVASDTPS